MNDTASQFEPQCPIDIDDLPPAAAAAVTVAAAPEPARPAAPAREVRVVVDRIPVMDTARFEHMQRIATIMAETTTLPQSLCMERNENGEFARRLPHNTVLANCFQVVNQAVRWGLDPFAAVQCASIVHNRLMWEGKLAAAVIEAQLGIRPKYTFTNDTADRRPADDSLGVVVSGRFRDETEDRTIEGTVAQWHRGSKSPWAQPANWKRQLRYMGAREWARAHAPAVMLGVIADDEARDFDDQPKPYRTTITAKPLPQVVAPDIPDEIPDDPEPVPANDADAPPYDADAFLDDLRAFMSSADDAGDVAMIRKRCAAELAKLSPAYREKAELILSGEE